MSGIADLYRNRGVNPLAVQGENRIAVDAYNMRNTGASSGNTITWSHTVGARTSRILIVSMSCTQGKYPTAVTYGGVALTKYVGSMVSPNGAYLWYLINPAVGTANCVVTMSGTDSYMSAASISFFGVDQTQPLLNGQTLSGTAQSPSFSVICTFSNSYILESMGAGGNDFTTSAGQVLFCDLDERVDAYDAGIVVGTNTQTWTGTSSRGYVWAGAELKCCI